MRFEKISRRSFVRLMGVTAAGMGSSVVVTACGGSSGGSSDTIKIGVMGPYSGDVAQYGLPCRYGAELYFEQINSQGGIGGKQVELNEQDEKGDATEAVNVYNKLVEDGVVAILGDITSTPTIAVAQASVADNMPMVTPVATAADVVNQGGNNVFRACFTDPYQGKLMADFAAERGLKTVGIIYNVGGDYEVGVTEAFEDEAAKKGISITSEQAYQAGDADFNSQITSILSTSPDAIFCPNYYQDTGKIITQARKQGFSGSFIGTDGWTAISNPEGQSYASGQDLQNCYYCAAFSANDEDEKVQQFVSDYKAKFNETPTSFCAMGYDAAMVLAEGIKAALDSGVSDLASDDGRQAIIDGIKNGTVDGVSGQISYPKNGDPAKSTLIIGFEPDGTEKVEESVPYQE